MADLTIASAAVISDVSVRLFRVPLPAILSDAKHGDHSHFELITVELTTSHGDTGVGYSYTGGRGGHAIAEVVEREFVPQLIGVDPDRIAAIWAHLERTVHYVARGGIVSFALSAVDIALWDLKLRRLGVSLWRYIGGGSTRARCYRGGIDLGYSLEELVASVRGYQEDGHTAVKIKVGQETLKEDVERVAAVRAAIGPDCTLMVDANMAWSAAQAVRAARAFARYEVHWLEEPTQPGDWSAYARIRREGGLPLAQGENLHTLEEARHAIGVAGIDFPQPDASNCGGITSWLKVAALAEAHGLPVCSHGMQELHVSLVGGVANSGWVEIHSFPIDEYTTRGRVVVAGGYAQPPDVPGTGVEFNWEKLEPHRVALGASLRPAAPRPRSLQPQATVRAGGGVGSQSRL